MNRFTLTETVKHTLEVKKSQFITWLLPLESKQQAKAYLQQAKEEYPDARHHCWAYVMGDSPNSMTAAMSDDGEPSGTAGKPMLNVLQHKPVNNVMAIVIRYFGGTKLGAGGLVRAYSQAVEQTYGLATLEEVIAKEVLCISVDFASEQWLRHIADKHHGEIIDTQYSTRVDMTVSFPNDQLDLVNQVLDSRGINRKTLD